MNIEKLHEIMKEKGVNPNDIARKVGRSPTYIYLCLNGNKEPSLRVFRCIVDCLGCSADEIL